MIDFSWGMIKDLELIVGEPEKALRIFATVQRWEQENNAKVNQTGKIIR
jgi:hypothetical protein